MHKDFFVVIIIYTLLFYERNYLSCRFEIIIFVGLIIIRMGTKTKRESSYKFSKLNGSLPDIVFIISVDLLND